MCYKIRNKELCSKAVTDIIICSRLIHKVYNTSKMAPNGFIAAGYIFIYINMLKCYKNLIILLLFSLFFFSIVNGVCVCYKTVDIVNENSNSQSYVNIEYELFYFRN